MDLEPELLRAFLTMYEARSITAAASAVGVSQPTMSGHLRRLREHFADPLFEFKKGTLHHTAGAEQLRDQIAAVVAGLDRLSAAGAKWSPATSDRRLRLAASPYVEELFAAGLDSRLREAGPRLRLDIFSPGTDETSPYDVAIAPRSSHPSGFKMRALFTERLVCLIDQSLLPADATLPLDLFCALGHLLVAPAPSPPHAAVDVALAAIGRSRRVERVVASNCDLAAMLKGSARLAMLPARSAARYGNGLAAIAAPLSMPPFSFAMAWSAARDTDPCGVWFRKQIVSVASTIR